MATCKVIIKSTSFRTDCSKLTRKLRKDLREEFPLNTTILFLIRRYHLLVLMLVNYFDCSLRTNKFYESLVKFVLDSIYFYWRLFCYYLSLPCHLPGFVLSFQLASCVNRLFNAHDQKQRYNFSIIFHSPQLIIIRCLQNADFFILFLLSFQEIFCSSLTLPELLFSHLRH